jgi:4-amino-4-deoxy-L-arabinose transferase-like glycosyltransferase
MSAASPAKPDLSQALRWTMLTIAAILFALHFTHLNADFPNHSPWLDRAKYTDEGWYSDAATRHFQVGHWYVPGDFNPAVALPIWPLIESIPFALFGASMTVARACAVIVFGLICAASWLLLYRWRDPNMKGQPRSLAPELAVLLLNTSPFCFAFFRMAVLEPPLILIILLALIAVTRTRNHPAAFRPLLILGALLPTIILTKTTGVAVFPAIAWLLWECIEPAQNASRFAIFFRKAAIASVVAVALAVIYIFAITHAHLAADARNVFAANAYRINRHNAFAALVHGLKDLRWIGLTLIPAAIAAIIAIIRPRRNPLIPTLLLWTAGYLAFIVYHGSRQPRYYLPVFVPLILLLSHIAARPFIGTIASKPRKLLAAATALALFAIVTLEARQTLHYAFHPDYTFLNAARQIRSTIAADPAHPPLLMSPSGSDLSLLTGVPTIGDLFTRLPPDQLAQRYRPGWLAVYLPLETTTRDSIAARFHPQEAARFHIMDDPALDTLILYRLTAASNVQYDKPNEQRLTPTP